LADGIRSNDPPDGSDGRRVENGGVLSHGMRARSIGGHGWTRRPVERSKQPQSHPLIGSITHQRGCRNRQGDTTRAGEARTRYSRPRDRSVTGRLSREVLSDGRCSSRDQLVETVQARDQSSRRADAVATTRPDGSGRGDANEHQDHQGPCSHPHRPLQMTRFHHAFATVGSKSRAHKSQALN
jgi:hypothetical protein